MAERRTGLQIAQDEEKRVKEALGVGSKGDTHTYEIKERPESPQQYSAPIPNVTGSKKKSAYVPKKVRDAAKAAKQAKLDELSKKAAEQKASDPRRLLYRKGPSQYSDKNYYVGDNKKTHTKPIMFVSGASNHPYYHSLSPEQQSVYNEAFQQHQIEHGEDAEFNIKQSHAHAESVVKRGTSRPAPSTPGTPPAHLSQLQKTSYGIAYSAQSKYLTPETAHTVAMGAAEHTGEREARKAESERLRAQNVRPMRLSEVEHSPAGSPDTMFSSSEQDYIRINTDVRLAADRHGEYPRAQHEQWSKEEILRHRNTTPAATPPSTASKPQSAKERVAAQEAAEASSGIPRVEYKGKKHYPPGTKQYTAHEQTMLDSGTSPSLLEIVRGAAVKNAEARSKREERKQGMGQVYNPSHIEAHKAVRDYQLAPTPATTSPEPKEETTMATIDPTSQSQERQAVKRGRGRPRKTTTPPPSGSLGNTKLPDVPASPPGPKPPSDDAITAMINNARAQSAARRAKKPKTETSAPAQPKELPKRGGKPTARERGYTKHPTVDEVPENSPSPEPVPEATPAQERTGATPPISSSDRRTAPSESFGGMINRVNKTQFKPSAVPKPVESFGSMINRTNKIGDEKDFTRHADEAVELANSGRSSSGLTQPNRTTAPPRHAVPNVEPPRRSEQPSYLGTLPSREGHHVYSSGDTIYAVESEHSGIAHGHVASKISGSSSTSEFHANMRSVPSVKSVSRTQWESSRGPSLLGKSRASTGPLPEPDPQVQAARRSLSDREPVNSMPRQSTAGRSAARSSRRYSMSDLPSSLPRLSGTSSANVSSSGPKLQPQQFGIGSKVRGFLGKLNPVASNERHANRILDKYGEF